MLYDIHEQYIKQSTTVLLKQGTQQLHSKVQIVQDVYNKYSDVWFWVKDSDWWHKQNIPQEQWGIKDIGVYGGASTD